MGASEFALDPQSSPAPAYVETLKAQPAAAALENMRGCSAFSQNCFAAALEYFAFAQHGVNNLSVAIYWLVVAQWYARPYTRGGCQDLRLARAGLPRRS
jgi:hypothetical protein